MQQIADWLEKLGMSEYAQRFAENRVDFSVLRDLTDQDLKDLGVVLGDRRKMLRAIANLDGLEKSAPAVPATANAAPPSTTFVSGPISAVAPPPISPAAEATGERRYVTVMFCDLVGSTSISAGLDAEEWRDLVGAYLDAASAAVTEMGGHVAKKLGRGESGLPRNERVLHEAHHLEISGRRPGPALSRRSAHVLPQLPPEPFALPPCCRSTASEKRVNNTAAASLTDACSACILRPRCAHVANSSSNAFASCRSSVSKPSVNQPYTGASSSRACCGLP